MMADTVTPVLQTGVRTRRSRSSTPLVANGNSAMIVTPGRKGRFHKEEKTWLDNGDTPVLNGDTPHIDASFRTGDKVSPMLAKLRMTPAGLLKDKQSLLIRKHEATRQKIDSLGVGGGVSIWPEMDSMRLTRADIVRLAGMCTVLMVLVCFVFYWLHGTAISELLLFRQKLLLFHVHHHIDLTDGQAQLDRSVVKWHDEFRDIVESVHQTFDVRNVPSSYMSYVCLYMATVAILLYYLVDNMFAKSKLSPRRIKRWVTLLCLTGTWTLLMALTLMAALRTEAAIESNIQLLHDTLADVISSSMESEKLQTVIWYWQTRCLPPTSHGTITIFGVLPIRDMTYYLQYYTIPIVTVLITPICKLVVSVMTVHNIGKEKS